MTMAATPAQQRRHQAIRRLVLALYRAEDEAKYQRFKVQAAADYDKKPAHVPTTARRVGTEPRSCTGLTASWCPVHGDCACPRYEEGGAEGDVVGGLMEDPSCPLHSPTSTHPRAGRRVMARVRLVGERAGTEVACWCGAPPVVRLDPTGAAEHGWLATGRREDGYVPVFRCSDHAQTARGYEATMLAPTVT